MNMRRSWDRWQSWEMVAGRPTWRNLTTSLVLAVVVVVALLLLSACATNATLDDQYGLPSDLVVQPDGSGSSVSTHRSWPSGTFRWDCTTMGDRTCGP